MRADGHMNHVTIVTRRADRRINGRSGARVTLCGGELTAYDITVSDAKAALRKGELAKWLSCEVCQRRCT